MNRAPSRRTLTIAAAVVAAALLLPLGARVAARDYRDDSLWANALASLGGTMKPGDFGYVFIAAGDDVLNGRNPYMRPEDFVGPPQAPYAYPPVLALVIVPFSALPEQVAQTFVPGVLWSLLLIAAMVGALLLLGVRDWRCYPVALLAPYMVETIQYGAVGPLLVLLVAVLWRYRDRPGIAAATTGAAVVLKLFLWPLYAWLAMTGRIRAAVGGMALALALALGSWAIIAFRGLVDYPRLLQKLDEVEAENSYSAFAVLRMLDVPELAARALVVAAGLALILGAWSAARDKGASAHERDRRSLTLILAAALVLTPILWLHYLVLLFVPIALHRPRLSPVWFVPLAVNVFVWLDWHRGWPRGEAEALVSTAVVVAVVFLATLLRPAAREARGSAEPLSA